jgi:hypothetical protein
MTTLVANNAACFLVQFEIDPFPELLGATTPGFYLDRPVGNTPLGSWSFARLRCCKQFILWI